MRDAVCRGRMDLDGLDVGHEAHREIGLSIIRSGSKLCNGCQQVKTLDAFHRARRQLHGRQSECKSCQAARKVATRANRRVIAS